MQNLCTDIVQQLGLVKLELCTVCTGKVIATHGCKVGGLIQFAPHYMTLGTLSVNCEPPHPVNVAGNSLYIGKLCL